ncbi:MAG: tripartite tricarboxylate transporter TctB family protein [Pseudomonadota bacterium]
MRLDSAAADRWTAIVLFCLGVAMLAGGYTMDRLEIRQIHPASIPGLVPMILGVAMMICSSLLFWSARSRVFVERATNAGNFGTEGTVEKQGSIGNLGFATLYSVTYALGLVGTLPFWLATTIYITVFFAHFSWPDMASTKVRILHGMLAIGFGLAGAFAIATLFEQGFLVRLP